MTGQTQKGLDYNTVAYSCLQITQTGAPDCFIIHRPWRPPPFLAWDSACPASPRLNAAETRAAYQILSLVLLLHSQSSPECRGN